MRIAILALIAAVAAAAVSCAAHRPTTGAMRVQRFLQAPRGTHLVLSGTGLSGTCLLSTAHKCTELMAQQPPHLCLLATGRCPSYGSVVPLASLVGQR